jgi:hypothetical protein
VFVKAVLGLYALWHVNCQEYVGDCDDGWHTAFMYSNPCSVTCFQHLALYLFQLGN